MANFMTRPASWSRALKAIVPYFLLLGKYFMLKAKYNRLQGLLYIELRKYDGSALGLHKKITKDRL